MNAISSINSFNLDTYFNNLSNITGQKDVSSTKPIGKTILDRFTINPAIASFDISAANSFFQTVNTLNLPPIETPLSSLTEFKQLVSTPVSDKPSPVSDFFDTVNNKSSASMEALIGSLKSSDDFSTSSALKELASAPQNDINFALSVGQLNRQRQDDNPAGAESRFSYNTAQTALNTYGQISTGDFSTTPSGTIFSSFV
ncbi:hypothetical protein MCHI_003096 [Candidatus Magnetoovum chiemensis]|nr:hypothetical protein MCHI_003096 [Candidatus Magnetoovum chiemensis]